MITRRHSALFLTRVVPLLAVAMLAGGFKFRCWMFCTDQTGVQSDYVAMRDKCREYAELKIDMAMRGFKDPDEKTRKTQMVSLFSDCMNNNAWNVPGPGAPDTPVRSSIMGAVSPYAKPKSPEPPPPPTGPTPEEKARLSRAADCAFARGTAGSSSISATRAEACDLECAQETKASPEGVRPASCPPE